MTCIVNACATQSTIRSSKARSSDRALFFSGPDSSFASRFGSLSWIDPLDSDMIVLDVACGAAHAAESIAASVRNVIGIEYSWSLLDLGAERIRDRGIRNVVLQEGNTEELPFVNDSFDVVFCRSSLYHFARPLIAVSEMVRVCRGGGRIVLLDIVPPSGDVRDLFDQVHRLIDPSHLRSSLESKMADMVPGGMKALAYANSFRCAYLST